VSFPISRAGQLNLNARSRNSAPKHGVLSLGIVLANGARQKPNAIAVTLTNAKGKVHQEVLAEPVVCRWAPQPFCYSAPAGRVSDPPST